MAETKVRGPEGQIVTVKHPDGASESEIIAYAKSHASGEQPKGDTHGVLWGAVLDTLGQTDRPGAVPLTGRPGFKTPAGVVLKPEGALEKTVQGMVTAPTIAGGGAGLGALASKIGIPALTAAAPAIGRVATAGALGGAEAGAKGESIGLGAIFDAVVSGLTEGAVSKVASGAKVPLLGKIEGLKERGAPARAYKWATEAIEQGLEAVSKRLPTTTKVNIPSLSQTPLTIEEAARKLKGLTGPHYERAYKELVSELNTVDKGRVIGGMTPRGTYGPVPVPRPYAGSQFKDVTSPVRFPPSTGAAAADAALPTVTSNEARAIADAIATSKAGSSGIPIGGIPLLSGAGTLGGLAERLKGQPMEGRQ